MKSLQLLVSVVLGLWVVPATVVRANFNITEVSVVTTTSSPVDVPAAAVESAVRNLGDRDGINGTLPGGNQIPCGAVGGAKPKGRLNITYPAGMSAVACQKWFYIPPLILTHFLLLNSLTHSPTLLLPPFY